MNAGYPQNQKDMPAKEPYISAKETYPERYAASEIIASRAVVTKMMTENTNAITQIK